MEYFNYGTGPVYIDDSDDNVSEALLMDCMEDLFDPVKVVVDDKKLEEIKESNKRV